MLRPILAEDRIHPAVRDKIANNQRALLDEVMAAVEAHDVVVVGMAQNPVPKKARKALDAISVDYHYMEYGSYLSQWRPRNVLKMWTGWPTFPMIFVKGTFIGGCADLNALISDNALQPLLDAPR